MSADGDHSQVASDRFTSGETSNERLSTRFRFKTKSSHRKENHGLRHPSQSSSNGRHRHHHHRRHSHKRSKTTASTEESSGARENTTSHLDPEVAFRESLFDAMADEEGATFWEGVYGQPIHTYPNETRNTETGALEKMSEEEYIAFVRREMWQRSREGIEAQRAERRRERLMKEQEQTRTDASKKGELGPSPFERDVDESLRRGHERKKQKVWRDRWISYQKAWDDLHRLSDLGKAATSGPDHQVVHLRGEIPWPVESGKRTGVNPANIESFMIKTAESTTSTGSAEERLQQLLLNLKSERVRWHPDKVQHRFGGLDIDEETLKSVTEVFQVLDQMYNERK